MELLGWTTSRNLQIESRWGVADPANVRKFAVELVASAPDVILSSGALSLGQLLQETRTVPIVFVNVADPVGAGFVNSLSRPGGNATGFMQFEYSLSAKWLELLKQVAPGVTRAAVLRDAALTSGTGQFAVIQSVASSVGVEVGPVNVHDAGEIERAVAAFARSPNGGIMVTSGALVVSHHELIVGLATRHKLPRSTIGDFSSTTAASFPMGTISRPVPPRGDLCRSHLQGRAAGRPAGASADEVRLGDQPQGCQSDWPHRAADLLARADEVIE